jgi:hypothetical protein
MKFLTGTAGRIEAELRRRLDDWRGLLRRHVFEARGVLCELMTGKIRFTPEADGRVRFRVECGMSGIISGSTASPNGIGTRVSVRPRFCQLYRQITYREGGR